LTWRTNRAFLLQAQGFTSQKCGPGLEKRGTPGPGKARRMQDRKTQEEGRLPMRIPTKKIFCKVGMLGGGKERKKRGLTIRENWISSARVNQKHSSPCKVRGQRGEDKKDYGGGGGAPPDSRRRSLRTWRMLGISVVMISYRALPKNKTKVSKKTTLGKILQIGKQKDPSEHHTHCLERGVLRILHQRNWWRPGGGKRKAPHA